MTETEQTHALYAQFLNFKPRKGDLRRLEIIESAIDCLSSIGVEASTLEAIGKRKKMAKAHVAYYFKDRHAIVEEAIKFATATAQSFTVKRVALAKPSDRLSAFIEGTFDWIESYPKHASAILLLYYYASFNPFYRKLHDDIRSLGAERLQAVIEPMLPKPRRKAAPQLAKLVQSILTGNLIDHFTTLPSPSLEALRKRTIRETADAVRLLVGLP